MSRSCLRCVVRCLGVAVWLAGCGGSTALPHGDASGDATGEGGSPPRRVQMLVSMSDGTGRVRVGTAVADEGDVLLVDAETQLPIVGALAEAIAEEGEGDDGYLVRLSKDGDGYRPEIVRVARGKNRTVAMGSSTPDVSGRAVRVSQRVSDEDLLGETDLPGVMMLAAQEARPDVLFVPALEADVMTSGARFSVYRSPLPTVLVAVKIEGTSPANGTLVRARARVVSTSGMRRAGAKVNPSSVAAAGQRRAGEDGTTPTVTDLSVASPDATGAGSFTWTIDDPDSRIVAFDVGLDSTAPDKRLDKSARSLSFNVHSGDHLACVRPVFAGADVDPEIRCASFAASQAPPAPNVRVRVTPAPSMNAVARRAAPVVVSVDNLGTMDAPAFSVDVVVSRDGRIEGGLGEVRTLLFDGIKAGGHVVRGTEVTPPRDGPLFVVARADALRTLVESNAEDNVGRLPLIVQPAGSNHTPVVSIASTALGAGGGLVLKGESINLGATAVDLEDGDLSSKLTWWSSRDGQVGAAGVVDVSKLSPGVHRLRAQVADAGMPAALAFPRGRNLGGRVETADHRAWLAAALPETATAELEIKIVDSQAPIDSAPVVSAGPDLTTTLGAEVVPQASALDPDGDALTYAWTAVDANGAAVPLLDSDHVRPRFTATAAGTYRLKVNVSDGKLSEADDLEVVVLTPDQNHPPRLEVSLPEVGVVGVAVTCVVTAVDDDMDGLALSYSLAGPSGSVAELQNGDSRTPTFVPDLPGTYAFTVRGDDGRGGTGQAQAHVVIAPATDGGVIDAGVIGVPDAGGGVDAPVLDARPPAIDAPLVPDGPPPSCDPIGQTGCSLGFGCFLRAGDGTACGTAGTGPVGSACSIDGQCAAGLACGGQICRPICDIQKPACAAPFTVCVLAPGNKRFGLCDKPTAIDAGTVPIDAAVSCDPVSGGGCGTAGEACYLASGGVPQCLSAGTAKEGQSCRLPSDCGPGTGCFEGIDGLLCRRQCDINRPACSTASPQCAPIGSHWGVCLPPAMADASAPVDCDPVKQFGCQPTGAACYLVGNEATATCALPGQSPIGALCQLATDCVAGSGCFDGPDGRVCRQYCNTQAAACGRLTPQCVVIGSGAFGICMAQAPQDAGVYDAVTAAP